MVEITEVTISVLNLVLALIVTTEILFIFKILSGKKFRQNMMKRTFSIYKLLNASRIIFLAAVFYCLTMVYYLFDKIGLTTVPMVYEFFQTLFLYFVFIGLFQYYRELKRIRETIISDEAKEKFDKKIETEKTPV